MNTTRKKRLLEIFTGLCFIVATVTYSVGSGLVEGVLSGSGRSGPLAFGIALELVNSLCVIAIGILLHLRLRSLGNVLTSGYLVSRIAEAVLLGIGSFSYFFFKTKALSSHALLFNIAMLILGLYSAWFFFSITKWSLGPGWLFIVGTIGYITLVLYSILGIVTQGRTEPLWLFGPGAIFEIIFPVWLIFKGFRLNQS